VLRVRAVVEGQCNVARRPVEVIVHAQHADSGPRRCAPNGGREPAALPRSALLHAQSVDDGAPPPRGW
jgi:hypothetical protein